ncbi:MAG: spore coat protein U domain-containing protein [Deltaproteobacteria bacterium]|nr:spore coat protein U domain-containing protein [Deltaproteobacteria bacterium]MCW5808670.1 spore coat protein U domain-containing protein [Deltaproteobacteria bacterium]
MRRLATAAAMLACLRAAPAEAGCSISAVKTAAFGSYNPLATTPVDTTGSFTYKCTAGTTITIDIDGGGAQNVQARRMTRTGGGSLAYQLYRDPTRLFVWGNTVTTNAGPMLGAVLDLEVFVYGRIFALQDVETGPYNDAVSVTINY